MSKIRANRIDGPLEIADRIIVIGGGRITAQGTRCRAAPAERHPVEEADLASLGATLHEALTALPADGARRLVDAEPEDVARAVMFGGVVLRRTRPAKRRRPRRPSSNWS